jgi:hypothetical protein
MPHKESTPNRTGQVARSVAVWIALLGVVAWIGVHEWNVKKEEAAESNRENLRREETQQAINALVASTDAVVDWRTALCDHGYTTPILTTDLQSALLRSDNRPVLVAGDLSDIRQQDREYLVTLSSHLCRGTQLRVEATADSEQAAGVLSHRSERIAFFAIALDVATVQKEAVTSDDGSDSSGEFVVRGQCLRLLFTGSSGFFIDIHSRLSAPH